MQGARKEQKSITQQTLRKEKKASHNKLCVTGVHVRTTMTITCFLVLLLCTHGSQIWLLFLGPIRNLFFLTEQRLHAVNEVKRVPCLLKNDKV